jgi:hypothetical protein
VSSPAVINNNGNINAIPVHAVNEVFSGGNPGLLTGVDKGKAGVAVNIVATVIFDPGR